VLVFTGSETSNEISVATAGCALISAPYFILIIAMQGLVWSSSSTLFWQC